MFFTTARGNRIYFSVMGDAARPPVLLAHGSTLTGEADFLTHSNLAARLAKDFRVIIPDCQGHGRSDSVWLGEGDARRLNYSFSEMARDLAELLVAQNASPAFVMGHSNGGNVALYLVKEQAAHVRAAIPLAANAHICDHLRARVPRGMDPDRVDREDPAWRDEMIALHDTHQGAGHWRHLLRATTTETITNPDWTRQDLAAALTPCLVVQGQNDRVNAPSRHAETLSEWLPNAQLWIPPGIGHSVHWEIPDEFERRARAFFAQHG